MLSNLTVENRNEYLEIIKKAETDTVFIAVDRCFFFTEDSRSMTSELSKHIDFFKSNGLEVGAWIQAFGFGNPLKDAEKEFTFGMTKIKSVSGNEAGDAFCPEDPDFMKMYCNTLKAVASASPELIMLDDDLCLSVRPGLGCFCDRHITLLEKKIGRALNKETIANQMFTGKGNDLRKAWLNVMGDSLRKFCHTVQKTIASVNPEIRIGFCAGFTSWDIEGVDAAELTRILAGKNKPFLRFTGAPYWVAPHWNRFRGQRLHGVIEFTREQEFWCKNSDIECFSEADCYPRPRYHIPGNLLECFDAAMTASGNNGILKYIFDYFAPPSYETGYVRLHKKNKGLYEFLEENFRNKNTVGIHVYEKMRKIAEMDLPSQFSEYDVLETALPVAASMLTSLGIPVQYDSIENSCSIAFGENVNDIIQMPAKLILDFKAALILKEKGIDTGILTIEEAKTPTYEVFNNIRTSITYPTGKYYKCYLKDNAKIQSYFESEHDIVPAAYIYNNGSTEFLVYTFDAYTINQSSTVFVSYMRQQQILNFNSDFPVIRNSPFVYQLSKKDENETVSFFANIFEDEMWDFDIELEDKYNSVECYGIEGTLNGNILHVHSTVPAYGMFAIKLRK